MRPKAAGLERFVKKHGATILTYVGATGVVITSISVAKATPKAMKVLELSKEEKGEELTFLEKVNVAAPAYIPSILIGAGTITSIIGANLMNKKQQASLMSAYLYLDSTFKEYRSKVNTLYGDGADEAVEAEIEKNHCPRRK